MIKRFIGYYRPHRRLLLLDVGTAFVNTACQIAIPVLVRGMLRYDLPAGDMRSVVLTIVQITGLVGMISLATYVTTKWGHILGTRMETDMRRDLFAHLQKLSFTYFDNTKTGHIMSRISNDLFTISEVAHHAVEDVCLSGSLTVGAFTVMFMFSPPLALISLAPLPIMLLWGTLYSRRMRRGFRRVRLRIADINSNVENAIQGIREVKAFANEDQEIEKFAEVNTEFRYAKEGMYSIMGGFHAGMRFMTDIYPIVVIGAGALLAHAGKVDLVDVITFMLFVRFIINPIRRAVNFVEQFQQGAASFERFTEIMDQEPDIRDREGAKSLPRVKGDIVVESLSFRYESSPDWVLRDIDLRVDPGRTVALVGESGAGKTTLASLIPRFYEAQEGRILIDGHDVLDIRQRSLRANIGLVPQNVFLFDSTIRENIMFGRNDATQQELEAAALNANILPFVESLPDGFDSVVGEHGVKLSGGQKQRLSIARVFLKDPPILIFDEATSSLDTESETLIKRAMEKLSHGRTTVIIAHRLSTVRNADHIFVMRGGRIVEQGSHATLLELGGYYHELYANTRL